MKTNGGSLTVKLRSTDAARADALCGVAVQFAVRHSPKEVLRLVAAIAKVQDLASLRELRPAFRMLPFPKMYNRIAKHDDIDGLPLKAFYQSATTQKTIRPPVVSEKPGVSRRVFRSPLYPRDG